MPGTVPTRGEARTRALMYVFMFAAGTWVILTPPRTIEGIIGTTSTFAWGILLGFASVAAVAAWKTKWRVEYALLPLLIAGVLIYAAAIWSDVPSTITRGPQACMLTAFALGLGTRLLALRKLTNKHAATRRRGLWNQDGSH